MESGILAALVQAAEKYGVNQALSLLKRLEFLSRMDGMDRLKQLVVYDALKFYILLESVAEPGRDNSDLHIETDLQAVINQTDLRAVINQPVHQSNAPDT